MTITLDIRPEVQAELARQAAARGRALETYAASLLEQATQVSPGELPRRSGQELIDVFADIRGLLTDEEIDTMFARNPSTARSIDLS